MRYCCRRSGQITLNRSFCRYHTVITKLSPSPSRTSATHEGDGTLLNGNEHEQDICPQPHVRPKINNGSVAMPSKK